MTAIATLLLFVLVGSNEPARCDLIEVNSYYDGEAKLILKQVMALDLHRDGCFHCEGWALVTDNGVRKTNRGYVAKLCGREIVAPIYRRTWSQVDPEQADQAWHPRERRRFEQVFVNR